MSELNIENIDVTVGNNSQNILPVPINKNPSPSVPDPMNYGSSPYPIPLKPPKNRAGNRTYRQKDIHYNQKTVHRYGNFSVVTSNSIAQL